VNDRPLSCLLVEDNPGDARLLREMLREAPPGAVALQHVTRMADAEAALRAQSFDVVLLDLGLPDSRDVASIQRVRAVAPAVPVVLLTGLDDEDLALRAARVGASDYLVKGQVDGRGLVRTLRYAVERRQVEGQRDQLRDQLLHFQKLDLVGRVAGGVAHDLNNILSVILATSGLCADGLSPADPLRHDLEEIQAAAGRAASLTKKLLLFSRRDASTPRNVDLGAVAADMEKMLGRLLGEQVQVTTSCEDGVGSVSIDPGHLEQVLVNLAVNARDAMPQGGRLSVEVRGARLEGGGQRPDGLPPGDYVSLEVTDTGVGMPAEVRAHLFEPFFTTKAAGLGTGLGLSTVYGIIGQAGGSIRFDSEVGKGTRFTILLPRVGGDAAPATPAAAWSTRRSGGTALVVEDDDALRRVARRVLESGAFKVIEARGAGEAFLAAEDPGLAIDLVLCDVVLPALDGKQVVERLQASRPGLRAVFMSGYSTADVERRGLVLSRWPFVHKPFSPAELMAAVAAAFRDREA